VRRTALITGGSRGLGLALARHLAADGWNVVVDGRDADALERARREVDAAGPGTVIALPGDIADPVHVAALVNAAAGQGGFELLVNNAGTLGPSPLPHVAWLRTGDLERILRTNVVAPLRLVQAALPHLRAARGAILNMTSDAAVEGYEGWGGYGASKAALEQLSRVLAAEETDVRVLWVDPGDMRTQMHQDAFPGEDISDRPTPETRVPGLLRLVDERWPSGRYRVEDLLERADPEPGPELVEAQ
jgi:NAD(P)-dependent dehydrogenase (short-subunit alcohol dehydrogenase family)